MGFRASRVDSLRRFPTGKHLGKVSRNARREGGLDTCRGLAVRCSTRGGARGRRLAAAECPNPMSSKAITRCSVRSQRPPAFGRRDERQGGWQREELKAGYQPVTRSPWERVLFSWDGCSDLQPHLQALTSCSCWGLDTPISPSPLPLNLRLRTEGRYADVRLRRNGDYLPFTTNAWRETGVRGSFESLCC